MLVDTGSFHTLIGQSDLEKGFLKDRTLKREVTSIPPDKVRIGGGRHDGYKIRGVKIRLATENKANISSFPSFIDVFPSVVYALYSESDKETAQIPSIMGTDCMIKNKLAIYFDPYNKEAYLTQVEDKKLP